MSHRSLLHADHAEPATRFPPGVAATNVTLAGVIARAGAAGDFAGPEALAAATAHARRATALGAAPAQVASSVRRALAAAAPPTMTVVSFETIARRLVRHALLSLLDD